MGVLLHWIAVKDGKGPSAAPRAGPASRLCPAAARAVGRQVGCTPKRVATLRPQTRHRCRLRVWSHSAGTRPWRDPAKWASTCIRRVPEEVQPRLRAASAQGQPATGQNRRGPATAAGAIGTSSEAAAGASTSMPSPIRARRGRSPPSGVPGEGTITYALGGGAAPDRRKQKGGEPPPALRSENPARGSAPPQRAKPRRWDTRTTRKGNRATWARHLQSELNHIETNTTMQCFRIIMILLQNYLINIVQDSEWKGIFSVFPISENLLCLRIQLQNSQQNQWAVECSAAEGKECAAKCQATICDSARHNAQDVIWLMGSALENDCVPHVTLPDDKAKSTWKYLKSCENKWKQDRITTSCTKPAYSQLFGRYGPKSGAGPKSQRTCNLPEFAPYTFDHICAWCSSWWWHCHTTSERKRYKWRLRLDFVGTKPAVTFIDSGWKLEIEFTHSVLRYNETLSTSSIGSFHPVLPLHKPLEWSPFLRCLDLLPWKIQFYSPPVVCLCNKRGNTCSYPRCLIR